MVEPLYDVSGMALKKVSDSEEPLEFQLTIAFRGPKRPTVFEAELDADELMCLLYLCQEMQQRHKLEVPADLPKPEGKPPAEPKIVAPKIVARPKKRRPVVKAKKRRTLH